MGARIFVAGLGTAGTIALGSLMARADVASIELDTSTPAPAATVVEPLTAPPPTVIRVVMRRTTPASGAASASSAATSGPTPAPAPAVVRPAPAPIPTASAAPPVARTQSS